MAAAGSATSGLRNIVEPHEREVSANDFPPALVRAMGDHNLRKAENWELISPEFVVTSEQMVRAGIMKGSIRENRESTPCPYVAFAVYLPEAGRYDIVTVFRGGVGFGEYETSVGNFFVKKINGANLPGALSESLRKIEMIFAGTNPNLVFVANYTDSIKSSFFR